MKKTNKIVTIILVIFSLITLTLFFSYKYFVHPERLTKQVSEYLNETLHLNTQLDNMNISLFPYPTVEVKDFAIDLNIQGNLQIKLAESKIKLQLLPLLFGKLEISEVELLRPVVLWEYFDPLPKQVVEKKSFSLDPKVLEILSGLKFKVTNGALVLRQNLLNQKSNTIRIEGINSNIKLPSLFDGSVDIKIADVLVMSDVLPNNFNSFTAKNINLNISDFNYDIQDIESIEWANCLLSADLGRTDNEYENINLKFNIQRQPSASGGILNYLDLKLEGKLDLNGSITPIIVDIPFTLNRQGQGKVLESLIWVDGNSLTLSGNLKDAFSSDISLSGHAELKGFSLPRWFGFARELVPSVQVLLNDISGKLDFYLTPRQVISEKLEASIMGMSLSGSGKLEDFYNPYLIIEGKTEFADVNILFPELLQLESIAPTFTQPPALPNTDDDDSENKFGFNIKVFAEKAKAYKFDFSQVDYTISDAKNGAKMLIQVGQAYSGKVEATVDVGSKFALDGTLKGVDLEPIFEILNGKKLVSGKLDAKVDVESLIGDLPVLMSNLSGTIEGKMQKGSFFSENKAVFSYNQIDLNAKMKGNGYKKDIPAYFSYPGTWKVILQNDDMQVTAKLDGALELDSKTYIPNSMNKVATNVNAKLNASKNASPFAKDILIEGNTFFSMNINKNTYSLTDFLGKAADTSVNANINISSQKATTVESDFSLSTTKPKQSLAYFGLNLANAQSSDAYTYLSATGKLKYVNNILDLRVTEGLLDSTKYHGDLLADFTKKANYKLNLALDTIDFNNYFPVDDDSPASDYPLDLLKSFNASGNIQITKAILIGQGLHNLRLPFVLSEGLLTVDSLYTNFAGTGDAKLSLSLQALERYYLQAKFLAQNVDLLAATVERKQEALVAGILNAFINVDTNFLNTKELLANLNGSWGIEAKNGYFTSVSGEEKWRKDLEIQENKKNNGLEQNTQSTVVSPRTNYQAITSTGMISNGVLSTQDFRLKDTAISVQGGGSLNLNNEEIDAKMVASLFGVPEVPITIKGKLSDPQTNMQLIGAITGTIGNIGLGVVNLLGNIITAPFRLFGIK